MYVTAVKANGYKNLKNAVISPHPEEAFVVPKTETISLLTAILWSLVWHFTTEEELKKLSTQ